MTAAVPELPAFPFAAVVGTDEAKLALLLATVDPAIGGVLLRGDKGSAKSTLARGLAALGERPFVELPLGAGEERVVGSLDLAAALTGGEVRVQPGLLAAAHGGVLYVDEVNLLPDHLVDVLLDVAASGVNRIERDGVSHVHPARFVLVGSMNPEEGDLRPQLLDRFGLAVDVRAATSPDERVEAVRRRLAFDADPGGFVDSWSAASSTLRSRLATARPAAVDDDVLLAASSLAVAAGAEGLRADLVLARAAAALAGWDGRPAADVEDLRWVARLVLAHRARRHPLDPPGTTPDLESLLDDVLGPPGSSSDGGAGGDGPGSGSDGGAAATGARREGSHEAGGRGSGDGDGHGRDAVDGLDGGDRVGADDESVVGPGAVARVLALPTVLPQQHPSATGRRPVPERRGRAVGATVPTSGVPLGEVAPVATVVAAAARWAANPEPAVESGREPTAFDRRFDRRVEAGDLREVQRAPKPGRLLVLAVDASGSMGADARMAAVKGALLGLLIDAYQRRDRVALVTFGGRGADVVLRPTASVEVARTRLDALPTGGDTPLADGIATALDLAVRSTTKVLRPLLVVVTDGRATAGPEPLSTALAAAASVARAKVPAVVVDVEPDGPGRLGLATDLAATMGARHLPLSDLRADRLEEAIRSL